MTNDSDKHEHPPNMCNVRKQLNINGPNMAGFQCDANWTWRRKSLGFFCQLLTKLKWKTESLPKFVVDRVRKLSICCSTKGKQFLIKPVPIWLRVPSKLMFKMWAKLMMAQVEMWASINELEQQTFIIKAKFYFKMTRIEQQTNWKYETNFAENTAKKFTMMNANPWLNKVWLYF